MREVEDPLRARPLPDQGVERRQQRRTVASARLLGECLRVRPGGLRPALHHDRDQPRVRHHGVELLALQPVVVRDVAAGADAQGRARQCHQPPPALGVAQIVVQQRIRNGPLGQVVDPLPAAPLGAHHLAVHQGPLDGDLGRRPVPPLAAVLRAAQLGRRQRALVAQLLDHGVVRTVGQIVAPVRVGAVGAAAEREVRPLLDGQDARRVRPVLEGPAARPVGVLHRPAAHRAQPGVGDQLVRAGQHRDRVQLDRAEVPQHPRHPCPAVRSPQEALGAQRDAAGLVGGEFDCGRRHRRHTSNPRRRH